MIYYHKYSGKTFTFIYLQTYIFPHIQLYFLSGTPIWMYLFFFFVCKKKGKRVGAQKYTSHMSSTLMAVFSYASCFSAKNSLYKHAFVFFL